MPVTKEDIEGTFVPLSEHPPEVSELCGIIGISESHLFPCLERVYKDGFSEAIQAAKDALLQGMAEGVHWSWRGVCITLGYLEYRPKRIYEGGRNGETHWGAAMKNWIYTIGWRKALTLFLAAILRHLVPPRGEEKFNTTQGTCPYEASAKTAECCR